MSERSRISDDEIVRKFRFGVKISCAIAIWQSIEEEVSARIKVDGRSATQEDVAKYFHLQRTGVSKGLAEGSLSLEALVTMLTQLGWKFGRLDQPKMPDAETRALKGYQEAVLLFRFDGTRSIHETISREAFVSLCALVSDTQFLILDARDNLDDEAWKGILTRVLPRIANLLCLPHVHHVPYRTITQFKDLRQRWGTAVARCLNAIPYYLGM